MKSKKPSTSLSSVLLIFLVSIIVSCNQKTSDELVSYGSVMESEISLMEPPPVAESLNPPPPQEVTERKLIKEGELSFETADLIQTRKQIDSAVKVHKGYISSEKENKYSDKLENTLTIRIPFQRFDHFINDAIKGVERLDNKDIRIRDVTEEFLDVEARLETKKDLEQRYRDLLKKANKVSEILEVEKQIGELRADIESIEGRLQYLKNQSSFSTITITYYKHAPTSIAYGNKFLEGFSNGWNNLLWFLVGLINIWPFILIVIGSIVLIKLWWKKKRL